MTEQFLNCPQVSSSLQEVSCRRVPKPVRTQVTPLRQGRREPMDHGPDLTLVGPPPALPEHPLATVAKNVAGVVLVLLGLVMALPGIPGQGILTMIVGITLIDFPGKRGLERRMIGRPRILRSINRLRARFHRAPLDLT